MSERSGSTFQERVSLWAIQCFGLAVANDRIERNHRFLEEALETVQANGGSREESHRLVDYVFDRRIGDLHQEVGGALITLAALCTSGGINMDCAGEDELRRVTDSINAIRAKRESKVDRERSLRSKSPLP